MHRKQQRSINSTVTKMWKLLKQIVKEDEGNFTLETNDFFRPSLKQIGNSVFDIRNYYIPQEGVNILPSNIETPLKEVKEKLLELLDNGAFDFLCNDAVNKRTNQYDAQGGVVFISQSLAPVFDIPTSALAGHVICDAFIALPGHSVLVLTLVDGDSFSKEVLEYNMSVARGVTVTLSRFMNECVHPVHGVLPASTLNNIVSFKARIDRLVTKSSHFVTKDSLVMNPTRYGKVLNAFWAGVAETKSLMTERGEIDDDSLRFLTREQCIILVENINSRDVQVMCGPRTGATTLMLEVARRLSRLGDTLLVCKSREERDRLRKVYRPAVSADELGTLDMSSYTVIVDETNVTRNYPVCSRWRFTNIQEELANLKMRTTAMKRDVDTVKGQIDALESYECQRQINFLFEEMDVLRLLSVKIKRFMTEHDRKKKALRHPPADDLSPVCGGRDLLAIRMKPQVIEFKQRIYGQEDVLCSIKEFLVEDKIHIDYLQTTIDSWIKKQDSVFFGEYFHDPAAINLERELERVTKQLQVKMERNSEKNDEVIPANLVDVYKGDDSVMKPHADVPQAAPIAPTPRSVSTMPSQQNISEGRVRSFLPQSNQCKDSDSGDKEKEETKTGGVGQMAIQFQDMMKRAENMDKSHSSQVEEPSISKGTLSDDYTASQERDMRASETQICIAEIAEQEKRLLTLEEEHDLQKRHLDLLYCDLPHEWFIKVHYLQRHQDVLSLYDVELPEVISEMVRPGPSHIQTSKLEISPEDESHKRPVKRSQIAKLRRFQQGLLKESDLFDIIGNMIVDDEDHLASLQALNGPVYVVGPSSLQVVCPKLHLDAARVNKDECHVTTDGELVNWEPDTWSRDRRRLWEYWGTCASTPIPLSPPHPTHTPVYSTPKYWETRTRVRVVKGKWSHVLEMGVVEAGQVDNELCVSQQRRSWCVHVGSCDSHEESICTTVWWEEEQGECHQNTVSNTPGTQATFHYGVVLDVGRGRVAFIDLNRGIVIGKCDGRFREDLYPVFGVGPSDECTVNMELISGDNIAITDTKMSLIHDALT
ncbi:uncharacterized protein LOC124113164 isoform X2 [Haliotis rufescens]|uniref:uncharacterized protein LOC124113164 isoform X2 n=2 Tax=Haliotis rufescens TaxID=6454 RepID=UPI00201F7840|nr:uncharacterized protein LOC124113164 isoform X2 [Haliotis rufescens]